MSDLSIRAPRARAITLNANEASQYGTSGAGFFLPWLLLAGSGVLWVLECAQAFRFLR